MIEVGCCAFNFGWLSLKDSLGLAKNLGFTHVDVGANGPAAQVDQTQAAAAPMRMGAAMRRLAQELELTLSELFVTAIWIDGQAMPTNHPDAGMQARICDQFRRLCRYAAAAGFTSVMGTPGIPHAGVDQERSWSVALEMATRMTAISSEEGVNYHVEPHKGSVIEDPDAAAAMAIAVPGLRYTLDYAHFIGQGIPQQEIEALHSYAGHLHAKPAAPGKYKCPIEESAINFRTMIQALSAAKWGGVIAVEYIGNGKVSEHSAHPAIQTALLAHTLGHEIGLLFPSGNSRGSAEENTSDHA